MSARPREYESPKEAARRLCKRWLGRGYKPDGWYPYTDANGAELYWRLRLRGPDGDKIIRPLAFLRGKYQLREPGFDGPRPLFRLHKLASAEVVFVVEGEKCVLALEHRGITATTSGSADSARKADWSPLAGKRVVIWPDADQPGAKYATDVIGEVRKLGESVEIELVDIRGLGLPEKGDAVDWLRSHPDATAADVLALPRTRPPASQAAADWPEPVSLPNGLPPVKPFDPRLMPSALMPWISDIAQRMQCPEDYPAISAMVCLATVVGRQVGIRPKRADDWLVVPNIWGAIVGRPSMMKSPALAEPMRMLHSMESEAAREYEVALKEYGANQLVAEEAQKAARKAVAKAIKEGGDALDRARRAVMEYEEDEPVRRRYVTNDPTVEKLGELLRDNPRGLLVFRDELVGWLRNLGREGHEADRAFYLEAWNGTGGFTFDRIGRGTVSLEAVTLSVLGGIQPGPLGRYLSGALHGGAGDDGLIQRLQLLVWPDPPTSWKNVDRYPDTDAKRIAREVYWRLDGLDAEALGAQLGENDRIPWLRFDRAAQDEFDSWREQLEERLRAGDLHPAMEAHLAKFRSLVPTLALLIHLADSPQGGPVTHVALMTACAWAEYLESHAARLYSQSLAPGTAAAIELDKHLKDLPDGFTARDVYTRNWHRLNRESTYAALQVMEDYGRIRGEQAAGPGRPTTRYVVHPKLRASE